MDGVPLLNSKSELCSGPTNTLKKPCCIVWSQLSSKTQMQEEALIMAPENGLPLSIAGLYSVRCPIVQLSSWLPAYIGLYELAFQVSPQTAMFVFPQSPSCCPLSEHGAPFILFGPRNLRLEETFPKGHRVARATASGSPRLPATPPPN